jgi:hypothetical protein
MCQARLEQSVVVSRAIRSQCPPWASVEKQAAGAWEPGKRAHSHCETFPLGMRGPVDCDRRGQEPGWGRKRENSHGMEVAATYYNTNFCASTQPSVPKPGTVRRKYSDSCQLRRASRLSEWPAPPNWRSNCGAQHLATSSAVLHIQMAERGFLCRQLWGFSPPGRLQSEPLRDCTPLALPGSASISWCLAPPRHSWSRFPLQRRNSPAWAQPLVVLWGELWVLPGA